jgi:D-sedoheptulose 7-phosphate isomerase
MPDARDVVRSRIEESLEVSRALLADETVDFTTAAAGLIAESLRGGGKVLFCGNGGSAADSMHLAAEFVGRFRFDRPALAGISLTDSQSILTCVGNDYAFEEVFARGVRAYGREGDVLVALSTSGTSPNVVRALEVAGELGLRRIAMTGRAGGDAARLSELCLRVPSDETARIQEGYMLVAHTICELVEAELFSP